MVSHLHTVRGNETEEHSLLTMLVVSVPGTIRTLVVAGSATAGGVLDGGAGGAGEDVGTGTTTTPAPVSVGRGAAVCSGGATDVDVASPPSKGPSSGSPLDTPRRPPRRPAIVALLGVFVGEDARLRRRVGCQV